MTKRLKIKDIPLDNIVIRNEQLHVQNDNEDIKRLASSIRKIGLLNLIYVYPADKHGKYVLLTGERYYLALKKLKRKTIKAIITRKLSEAEVREVQLAESLPQKLSIEDIRGVIEKIRKKVDG
ncbi:MAG: ParB N-terminal domain-containing protein [Syntrophales bacterium]